MRRKPVIAHNPMQMSLARRPSFFLSLARSSRIIIINIILFYFSSAAGLFYESVIARRRIGLPEIYTGRVA